MAQATDTQLGEIQLAGDLAGDGGAQVGTNPQLTHQSITAGNYPLANITVNSKGIITDIDHASVGDVSGLIPSASASTRGTVKIGDNLNITGAGVASFWTIDFGGTIVGGNPTNVDTCAVYTFDIAVDGGSTQNISIAGGDMTTFNNVITQLNNSISGATASISGGDIVITSDSSDSGTNVIVSNDNLFRCMDGFVGIGSRTLGNGPCELSVPEATAVVAGVVKIGTGINVTDGEISIPSSSFTPATTTELGGVIVPTNGNIDVDGSGNISVPIASGVTPGVLQVGSGINVDGSGVISLNVGSITPVDATTTTKGIMQIGDYLNDDAGSGIVGVDLADGSTSYGVVKSADTGRIVISNGEIDVGPNVATTDTPTTWAAMHTITPIQINPASGNVDLDGSSSNIFILYLDGNTFLTLSNPINGVHYTIRVINGISGHTLTFAGADFKFMNGGQTSLATSGVVACFQFGTYAYSVISEE